MTIKLGNELRMSIWYINQNNNNDNKLVNVALSIYELIQ